MNEKIFLENDSVKVTNSRFIVGSQTYAMAAVNSVKISSTDITPSKTIPRIMIIVGILWLVGALAASKGLGSYIIPILLLAIGIFWFRSIKKIFEYKVILTTSSGEASALKSTDEEDVRCVEKALHEAIIFRG